MTKLRVSKDLSLPNEAVTQTFAYLGKRGSGKTYAAGVMVEQMIRAGLPVVVVDPIGVWWGLRFGADGKSPGLPVLILGGEHGDVPLEEGAGAIIADFVIESQRPAVLDLGLFTKSAARRFMLAFCDRLYHAKATRKEALHVVLDEADSFIPQRIEHGGEQLVGAINDIVRRGRARGLGVTLISQRPALINKDVLTQIEVLVALRLTGPHDRDAIERWVEHNADQVAAKQVLATLPTLEIGEAWVWSPGWLNLFKRVKIDMRTTFDSSATPKAGAKVVAPKNAAAVDLDALRARIADTIERAKADDPKTLKAEITKLQKTLAARPDGGHTKVERVEVSVLTAADRNVMSEALVAMREGVLAVETATSRCLAALQRQTPPKHASFTSPRPAPEPGQKVKEVTVAAPGVGTNGLIGGAERKILQVLAQHGGRTKIQIALLAGYAHSGGGFNNALSALRTKGLIEGRDDIRITGAGRGVAGPVSELPCGRELVAMWMAHPKLGKAERSILGVVTHEARSFTRDEIAERAGYAADGGGFNTALSRLRTLELVKGTREVRANDTLFG